MITAASLNEYTRKDLAEMAKEKGVTGWHAMRKDQLVRALIRSAKKSASTKRRNGSTERTNSKRRSTTRVSSGRASGRNERSTANSRKSAARGKSSGAVKAARKSNGHVSHKDDARSKPSSVIRRIEMAKAERERLKDLSSYCATVTKNGSNKKNGHAKRTITKDRVVLMVRDPYWLHVCWEVSRRSVERVQAAMKAYWHTAVPMMRLLEVDGGTTTSTAERVAREIEIHGGVNNWYVDVHDAPKSYRVEIGYKGDNDKFYPLARSNSVTTPSPGSSDSLDENWDDVARNYEKIYAMSGGYSEQKSAGELKELFEERLRRPMGSPLVTRYGVGAERAAVGRGGQFAFEVDAELIVYGQTNPDAFVTLSGKPVKLRPDGSFTVRQAMPDRRQVLPVVAGSSDGVEQRTIVLAIERNTKVMEPVTVDPNE